jgi:hypothetical protein
MIEAYPLTWPVGWKRTDPHRRKTSEYKVDFGRARDEVVRELRLLGAVTSTIVISSNIPTRRDGLPYSGMAEPHDPGIAVYWSVRRYDRAASRDTLIERTIACDVWRRTRENMRALSLAIGALRMLERTGTSEILDRAFTGFAALPPASNGSRAWWEVLGFQSPIALDVAEDAYRRGAREHHPDIAGGSHEMMVELNRAIEEARKHHGARA